MINEALITSDSLYYVAVENVGLPIYLSIPSTIAFLRQFLVYYVMHFRCSLFSLATVDKRRLGLAQALISSIL